MNAYNIIFTPEAQAQLDDLEAWVAQRATPRIVWNYIDRLVAAVEQLALMPFVGTKREDLGAGFRTKGFEGRVTVLFHIEAQDVVIMGIFYGGRQVVHP